MCSQNSPQIQNTNAPLVEIELLSKKQILKPLLRKKKYSTCLKKKAKKKKNLKKIRIFTKTYSKIIMVSKNNDKRNDNTSRKRNKLCEPRQRETICKKKPKIQTKGGIIISKSRKVKEKLTVEEIKKRKKERNRTNAKRFREKRKNFLQQLEHETNQLKSENQNLNHQLNQISQQNLLLRQQVEQLKKIQPTTQITKKPACNNHNKQTQTRDKIEELNEIEKIDVIDKIDETHIKERQDEKEKQAETERNDEIEETEQFEKRENKEKTENKEQNEKKQEHEYFDHRKQIEFLNLEFEKNFKNKYSGMNGCNLFEKDLNWKISKNNSLLELQQEAILETSGVFYDCGFEIIGKEMNPSNNMDSFENDNNCPLFNSSVWGENFN
ncbi:basic leucine zipper [Anaeramoeba flamelloides]|uniref:Basic leucine zipper n=1 Tax=Anaeramoeba flamelloides TaxID=1746091 RepID=A0AAV7YAY5_9EUKA|nr:basic leucine zipper [Anaeramoeba flamelloides]